MAKQKFVHYVPRPKPRKRPGRHKKKIKQTRKKTTERISMSRIIVLEKISREADELARQYNKTKDSGLRDQWYELIKKVSQVDPKDHLQDKQT
jgi:hypothetical protein